MFIKTLHLTNAYHEHSGGIRTMYHALLEQANREHRLMRLVVPAPADRIERVGRFGLIYHVRAPRALAVDTRYRVLLPHRFLWPGVGRLWQILAKESPDVLEVCDKYSLCYLAGLLRRRYRVDERPTLIGLSSERLDDNLAVYLGAHDALRHAARAYLGRAYIGMFDAHIANSDYTANELRDAMRAPYERPVHVCPMGASLPVPPSAPERVDARRQLLGDGHEPGTPLIMYAGRLAPEKHLHVLPEVMARLAAAGSPACLVIAGDGPLRAWLERQLKEDAPGRAIFVGHVTDRTLLGRHLAASDVFLHPNPREPFGIAPLEAMAAGVPLVAPAAGGVLSYATADNAWLTRTAPAAFAEAIMAVLAGGPERRRRVANAELTARQFTWPDAAARMFRTYDWLHGARVARQGRDDRRPAATIQERLTSGSGPPAGVVERRRLPAR